MRRRRLASIPLIILAAGLTAARDAADSHAGRPTGLVMRAVGPRCADPDGLVGRIRAMVSSSDTVAGLQSRRIAGLPAMPAESVSAVTDTSVCRRAALAYGRSLHPPDTLSPSVVSVVRVGSGIYVVTDSTMRGGEWVARLVFTSTLRDTAFSSFAY